MLNFQFLNKPFWWIALAVILSGCLIFWLLGSIIDEIARMTTASIFLPLLWIGIYIYLGFEIIPQQHFKVIERLGKFYRVAFAGPCLFCLPGIIDRARKTDVDNIEYQILIMYKDEPEKTFAIDFKDSSAAVKAEIWWRVSDPKTPDELEKDVENFAYNTDRPTRRLEEVMDGYARPILQEETTDSIQVNMSNISAKISKSSQLKKVFKGMGISLHPTKGFVISDVILPTDIQELRKESLQGTKDAERSKSRGEGYANTIKVIAEKLGISVEEATHIYETQRGLETVGETGANITFVGENVKGVLGTIGIGKTASTP